MLLQASDTVDAGATRHPEGARRRHETDVGAVRLGLIHHEHRRLAVTRRLDTRGLVQQQARGADRRADLRDRALHERMLGDGRLPRPLRLGLRHLDHVVERRFADAEVDRGIAEAEALQIDGEVLAGRADDVLGRHRAVVPDRVADRAAHAGRVPDAFELHARVALRDERGDDAVLRGGVAVDDAGDEVVIRRVADRAEVLDAGHVIAAVRQLPEHGVQHELVAEALLGLARDRRDERAAPDDVSEIALLLLLGPERRDERRHRRMHVERERRRGAPAGQLAQAVRVGDGVRADAPVRLRHGERQQAFAMQVGVVLERERRLGIVLRRTGREARARERGHAVDQLRLLVVEGRERKHAAYHSASP